MMNTNNKNETPKEKLNTQEPEYYVYSTLLKEPFKTIEELKEAEEAYHAKQKAKEEAAATKKLDAVKVEDAFKSMNQVRKSYKQDMKELTDKYYAELQALRKSFEADKAKANQLLEAAENCYAGELKAFSNKYGSFHITLKDGDFETTISNEILKPTDGSAPKTKPRDLWDLFFGF